MRMGSGNSFIIRNFLVCIVHLILLRVIKSIKLKWTRYVARIEIKSVFNILTGKPTEKRPLGRLSSTWDDNIRTNL